MKKQNLATIVRELNNLALSGIYYTKDNFDKERFERILNLWADLISLDSRGGFGGALDFSRLERGPQTPKVAVRVGVFNDLNQILLVKERADSKWSLPGGWVDVNMTPSEAAIAEVEEESFVRIKDLKLCGLFDQRKLYDNPIFHILCIFFIAKVDKLYLFTETDEVVERGFFSRGNIPELSHKRIRASEIDILFDYESGHQTAAFSE